MESNELMHYGIKGQRWGLRRYQKKNGRLTDSGKKRYESWSDDAKTANELKRKKMHQMTNSEIKKLIERLNLEKQYRELNKAQISRGKRFVNSALKLTADAGRDVAKQYMSKYMRTQLDKKIFKTS